MGDEVERSTLDLPDELTGTTPRSAILSDNARRGAILLPLGFIIVLIITIHIARTEIPQIRTRIALRSDTRLAVAQITSLHSGGRGVEIVEFTFNGAGKRTSGSARVPYDFSKLCGSRSRSSCATSHQTRQQTIPMPGSGLRARRSSSAVLYSGVSGLLGS